MDRTLIASLGSSELYVLRRLARSSDSVSRLVMVSLGGGGEQARRARDAFSNVEFVCSKTGIECRLVEVPPSEDLVYRLSRLLEEEARDSGDVRLFLTEGPAILIVSLLIAGLLMSPELQRKIAIEVWGEDSGMQLVVSLSLVSRIVRLDEAERGILRLLSERPGGLRASELVSLLGVARSTLYKKLRGLVESGLVAEEGGVYRVRDPALRPRA